MLLYQPACEPDLMGRIDALNELRVTLNRDSDKTLRAPFEAAFWERRKICANLWRQHALRSETASGRLLVETKAVIDYSSQD